MVPVQITGPVSRFQPKRPTKRMKKQIALFAIVAAALIAVPAVSRAQDNKAGKNTPAAADQAAPAKKHGQPFHGKISAVDAKASTLTVGQMTINVTADTKITKDGKTATLADLAVGDQAGGFCRKDDAGKLTAATINIGAKGAKAEKGGKNKPQ